MTTSNSVRPPVANVLQKNWQDLIKPTKLEIQPGRQKNQVATMVAEPLERGRPRFLEHSFDLSSIRPGA